MSLKYMPEIISVAALDKFQKFRCFEIYVYIEILQ